MSQLSADVERCNFIAEVMKALGHPVRFRIVALLTEGDRHVGAIADALAVSQAAVSQQLSVLRARGLVSCVREDGRAVYSIAESRLRDLVSCMEGCEAR